MAEIKHRGQKRTDGLVGKLTFEQDNNRIIGRDVENTPALEIIADGREFNFKIALPGVNVFTAPDGQLIFQAGRKLFKVIETGSINITLSAASGSAVSTTAVSKAHGMGFAFKPVVFAFLDDSGQTRPLPTYIGVRTSISGSNPGHIAFDSWLTTSVDDSDFIVAGYNALTSSQGPFKIDYYITQESTEPVILPFHTLFDNFTIDRMDLGKWADYSDGGGGLVFDEGEVNLVTPGGSSVNAVLASRNTYTLEDSYAHLEVTDFFMPGTDLTQPFFFDFIGSVRTSTFAIAKNGASPTGYTLTMQTNIDGGFVDFDVIPYDAVAHRWLRFRESGDELFFETSPDAETWTVRLSADIPDANEKMGAVAMALSNSDASNAAFVTIDNFNLENS